MKDGCVFCAYIEGNKPYHEKVWEDAEHVAFLTIEPVTPGHVLVVPKKHAEYEFDMDKESYVSLMRAVWSVAAPLKEATKKERIVTIVEGFSVPHVHVHLIPSNREEGGVRVGGMLATPEALAETAEMLRPFFTV